MFSLFCVLCVLAQLSNNTVHAAVIVVKKIHLNGFIGSSLVVDLRLETKASEDSWRANPRTVCCSKIYPALDEGAIQCSFVSEPALVVVVL